MGEEKKEFGKKHRLSAARLLARPPQSEDRAQIRADLEKKARSMSLEELVQAFVDATLLVEGLDRLAARRAIQQSEQRRDRARKAADVSHREDRRKKEQVISAYLEGSIPIKDQAAQKLASEFGIQFGTARKHLTNVIHPLVRKT